MREILFRAKRRDIGEWVEGSLVYYRHIISVISHDEQHYNYYGNLPSFRVFPETIGQYTGLTDRNGVKIFEGDILKLKDYHGTRIVRVFWGDMGSWFYGGDGFSDEYIFNSHDKKVIGNVYDNPEMLGGEKNETD